MSAEMDVLERFHRALTEEIAAKRPESLAAPFTVAEIYQDLVPYGSHRDRIGVEMNGDYEHALVRLLSGEGGFLVVESEAALKALKQELRSPNPNTGIYREYAAVDVRLNPALAPQASDFEPASPEDVTVTPMEDLVPVGDLAPLESVEDDESSPPAPPPTGGEPCRWCRAELPRREGLRFCPFCGTDVSHVPCPSCGKELEPEWRFCIACGTEVDG